MGDPYSCIFKSAGAWFDMLMHSISIMRTVIRSEQIALDYWVRGSYMYRMHAFIVPVIRYPAVTGRK